MRRFWIELFDDHELMIVLRGGSILNKLLRLALSLEE